MTKETVIELLLLIDSTDKEEIENILIKGNIYSWVYSGRSLLESKVLEEELFKTIEFYLKGFYNEETRRVQNVVGLPSNNIFFISETDKEAILLAKETDFNIEREENFTIHDYFLNINKDILLGLNIKVELLISAINTSEYLNIKNFKNIKVH